VTLRRLDLAAEIYHLREPQKIPQVISRDGARRLLAVADSLRTRLLSGRWWSSQRVCTRSKPFSGGSSDVMSCSMASKLGSFYIPEQLDVNVGGNDPAGRSDLVAEPNCH
jgi:hypothetical protein